MVEAFGVTQLDNESRFRLMFNGPLCALSCYSCGEAKTSKIKVSGTPFCVAKVRVPLLRLASKGLKVNWFEGVRRGPRQVEA